MSPADVSLGDTHDALASAWIEADDALARALRADARAAEAIREPTALSPELRNQIGAIIQACDIGQAGAESKELG
jgi:hypothetical protein